MKLHLITIGQPKLDYAKLGFAEYLKRLRHYHQVGVTHLPDRRNNTEHILGAAGNSYKIGLIIDGQQFSSLELAAFLEKRSLDSKELGFIIGGPDGLPPEVISALDYQWSFGNLTLPHDLAMVTLIEALYRASTISAGHPYHRQ